MFWTEKLPKHVEFYSKNKFGKLVQLVGFIIRIYHDAWSHECQILEPYFAVKFPVIIKYIF